MQFSSSARAADENVDYLFKVILIGDSNVGKTCVVQHFKSGVYIESQQNTIGVDFTVRSLEIDGKKVKMQVWDTGQERFGPSPKATTVVLTQISSPHDLTRGNKSDLWEKRHVLFEDACTLAEKYGLLAVLETSAKESRNIDEVFMLMAKELIARNSLHLYGESIQQGLSQDASPILVAQGPSENTRCTC
ncbi:hypothetical protein STEG23_030444 [Scotinomys teguina]